jgi:hypothetical protein
MGKHSDIKFYEIAAQEINQGKVNQGLMAKALVDCDGDQKASELLYIKWRVELLQEESIDENLKNEAVPILMDSNENSGTDAEADYKLGVKAG